MGTQTNNSFWRELKNSIQGKQFQQFSSDPIFQNYESTIKPSGVYVTPPPEISENQNIEHRKTQVSATFHLRQVLKTQKILLNLVESIPHYHW